MKDEDQKEVVQELDRLALEYGNLATKARRERDKARLVMLLDDIERCESKMEVLRSYIM
jgi:hypothetical protein